MELEQFYQSPIKQGQRCPFSVKEWAVFSNSTTTSIHSPALLLRARYMYVQYIYIFYYYYFFFTSVVAVGSSVAAACLKARLQTWP